MDEGTTWVCPYCNQPTTITEPNIDSGWHFSSIDGSRINENHPVGWRGTIVACPNIDCKQVYFVVDLKKGAYNQYRQEIETDTVLGHWVLKPDSKAKPQPAYIPTQIAEDYIEACRIKDLSPKASATLSRRCLQGMIRDFWGIKVKSSMLSDEIKELKDKISTEEWSAIDAVRSVGNIGAHMEQDVNLIIDVEPEEADLLISLIEDLFKGWYITKHDRKERQMKIVELAKSKKEAKNAKVKHSET